MADPTGRARALRDEFEQKFGRQPELIARAPGRVELIGGHTDYNDGYVLPAAIDLDVLVAASPKQGTSVDAWSADFGQTDSFSLDEITRHPDMGWPNYIRGVLHELREQGIRLPGMDLAVAGNIPQGSGLSSSAAIEVATASAALRLAATELPITELARLCQRAENRFAGVNSGIMDQFISIGGKPGCAMFLDCRKLRYSYAELPHGTRILICDSKMPRTLAGSGYNERRASCERARDILKTEMPGISALRDVSIDDLSLYEHLLPETERKRAHHIVCENERVLESFVALESGDARRFGELLNQSHASARDLYEISTPEIDLLQRVAASTPGCLGSRLMGGGFGGATVSLVAEEAVSAVADTVRAAYAAEMNREADVMVLQASGGAEILQ